MHVKCCVLTFIFVLGSALATVHLDSLPQQHQEPGAKQWAVLVAGSMGWSNYRHQADVCHAYQIMKDHGIPEENIIVMMYDDIANNRENPTPGEIINKPMGNDVYQGVKIDYRHRDVTPEVFLAVLLGDKDKVSGKGTGRVLESGQQDHVFINFVDHGAPGLVAFPTKEMHAREFMNALKSMHESKKYAQMVIYLEACESGSMFKHLLPDNINIYAMTASNSHESSYATYFDKKRNTYLGDLYSVNWMENSDKSDLTTETMASQFNVVKRETNRSHVMEYGDLKISQEPVGAFQGHSSNASNVYSPLILTDSVPSDDVNLHVLIHRVGDAETEDERERLEDEIIEEMTIRYTISTEMESIVSVALRHDHALTSSMMSERSEEIEFDCYEPAVRYYSHKCRKLSSNSYALRVLFALQNLCNQEAASVGVIMSAMDEVCV